MINHKHFSSFWWNFILDIWRENISLVGFVNCFEYLDGHFVLMAWVNLQLLRMAWHPKIRFIKICASIEKTNGDSWKSYQSTVCNASHSYRYVRLIYRFFAFSQVITIVATHIQTPQCACYLRYLEYKQNEIPTSFRHKEFISCVMIFRE